MPLSNSFFDTSIVKVPEDQERSHDAYLGKSWQFITISLHYKLNQGSD